MVLIFEEESYKIRGSAFDVYKQLGCGHKELVYKQAMKIALEGKGLSVELEKQLVVYFSGQKVGVYIPDSLVNNTIVVEYKAKPFISKHDLEQFWHYLTSTEFKLGFLINFGKAGGVEIIRRVYDKTRK